MSCLRTVLILILLIFSMAAPSSADAAVIRSTDKDDPTYVIVTPLNEEWVRFEHCLAVGQPCRSLGDYKIAGLAQRRARLRAMGYGLYTAQVGILAVGLVASLGLLTGSWAPAGWVATIFNAATGTGAVIASKLIFLVTGTGMALSSGLIGGLTLMGASYYATTVNAIDGGRRLSMAATLSERNLKGGDVVIEVPMPIVTFVKDLRDALSRVDNTVQPLPPLAPGPMDLEGGVWLGMPL